VVPYLQGNKGGGVDISNLQPIRKFHYRASCKRIYLKFVFVRKGFIHKIGASTCVQEYLNFVFIIIGGTEGATKDQL
jgi:hypothetical protein